MRRIFSIILFTAILFTINIIPVSGDDRDDGNTVKDFGTASVTASRVSSQLTIAGVTTASTSSAAINMSSAAFALDKDEVYSIKELQELAVKNSRQSLADDINIKKKEMAVRTVRSDASAMGDSIRSITRPMEVKLELEAAVKTKQDNLKQLKLEVYKTAVNIQLALKKIGVQEKKLEIAAEKLSASEARFKASSITQESLDAAQYDYDSKSIELTTAGEELDSLYMELRKQLNQTLDTTPVKVDVDIQPEVFEDLDVDFALNSLYKTETSVYKAEGTYDIARTAMDIAEKLYCKGDLTYDSCAINLEEAGLDLDNARNSLEVKVKNTYNNLLNRLDNIQLAGKYSELAEKKLAGAKLKYERGTISMEEYLSAEEAVLDAEYRELSAIVDFNIIKAEFDNIMGVK